MPSVNHAPIGTNNTVTALEDTAYVFTAANFDFTDPNDSPANNLHSVKISTTPMFGSLTNNGFFVTSGSFISLSDINAGNLRYTAASNANGTSYASFSFCVKDDGGTSGGGVDVDTTARTMTINVTAVNDAPSFMATNPTAVAEDASPVTVTSWVMMFYRGGGSDESSQTVSAYTVTDVSNASLFSVQPAVATNGTLTYTVAANANGSSTFKVAVQDSGGTSSGGQNTSATQTFTITVNPVNDAPVAVGEGTFFGAKNQTLNIAAPGVLYNDTDADNNTLTPSVVSNVSHGTLTLNSDGSFSYAPSSNYTGTDSFTYKVNDGLTDSNTVTVDIEISYMPPIGLEQDADIQNSTATVFTLAGHSDQNNTLSYFITSLPTRGILYDGPNTSGHQITSTDLSGGAYALSDSLHRVYYVPDSDKFGEDGFNFKVNDTVQDRNGTYFTRNHFELQAFGLVPAAWLASRTASVGV